MANRRRYNQRLHVPRRVAPSPLRRKPYGFRDYLYHRYTPQPIKLYRSIRQRTSLRDLPRRTIVRGSVHPSSAKLERGILRASLQYRDCRARKSYKKTMLKKIAAQVLNAGGAGRLNRWRAQRAARRNVTFWC